MEGTEGHDVVDDIKIELNEVIEDNILDNEDIDIDYDVFIDEDVVDGENFELGDVNSLESVTNPHLSHFVSQTFYIFYRAIIYLHDSMPST